MKDEWWIALKLNVGGLLFGAILIFVYPYWYTLNSGHICMYTIYLYSVVRYASLSVLSTVIWCLGCFTSALCAFNVLSALRSLALGTIVSEPGILDGSTKATTDNTIQLLMRPKSLERDAPQSVHETPHRRATKTLIPSTPGTSTGTIYETPIGSHGRGITPASSPTFQSLYGTPKSARLCSAMQGISTALSHPS